MNTQNNLKKFSRDDRLTILAQVCTDNDVTPLKGNFAGLIRKICIGNLNASESVAKELTRALTVMYRNDQWSSLLNPELDEVPGESGLEPNRINLIYNEPTKICNSIVPLPPIINSKQDRESLHSEMQKLASNSHPEPVKHIEVKENMQQDHLTEKQIAQILHTTAQRDTFDGVGRIILSDARSIADNKHLQIDDVITLWRRYYPIIDIDSRSNVALVYWNGKDTIQTYRKINAIVQPKAPIFIANSNLEGDIYEDDDEDIQEAKDT
jgi:hypothetical protein